jgi:hypothetical protein
MLAANRSNGSTQTSNGENGITGKPGQDPFRDLGLPGSDPKKNFAHELWNRTGELHE